MVSFDISIPNAFIDKNNNSCILHTVHLNDYYMDEHNLIEITENLFKSLNKNTLYDLYKNKDLFLMNVKNNNYYYRCDFGNIKILMIKKYEDDKINKTQREKVGDNNISIIEFEWKQFKRSNF